MCQEHFIKRMTEKAYEQARIDQRKNVTLKDMCRSSGLGFRLHMEIQLIKPFLTSATAIKNYPEFEFLSGKPSIHLLRAKTFFQYSGYQVK